MSGKQTLNNNRGAGVKWRQRFFVEKGGKSCPKYVEKQVWN